MTKLISKTKITEFISANIIVIVYGVLSIALELFSLLFFDCSFFIKKPFFPLLLWLSLILMMFLIRGKRMKAFLTFLLLLLQCALIMGCNYLFLSNGTFFEKSMLNQRNDAYATIEQIYLTPALLTMCITLLVGYLIFLIIYVRKNRKTIKKKLSYGKRARRIAFGVNLLLVALLFAIPFCDAMKNKTIDYKKILYNADNNYQELGLSSNFVYEMISALIPNQIDTSNIGDIETCIYSERCDISDYNGISAGNNLIMILAESFEWYPLKMYSEDLTKKIYPNLSKLMSESICCNNFYSREKTDTAEALTIIGSNPTGKYIHNDFPNNAYPYSMPNLFRQAALEAGDEDVVIRSFHQNDGNFYNRLNAHKNFGFDELVDIKAMEEQGVINTWNTKQRERNLDSLTMESMKDEMFPTNKRFFSYWITFSSHGFYNERTNLKEYYDKFDELGVFPEGNKYESYLRTYAAAVADLDKAIGIMFEDLEKKGLLNKTTILMVADHNTYYNGLSKYAKEIDTQFKPELYRVPMLIYDQKLTASMKADNKSLSVSKFTTTTDVIPTLLDLFGIPAWKNLYLGTTVFKEDTESIIFSRAYNIFITDKYIGYSLNNLKYVDSDATQNTKDDFVDRALIYLNKLESIDRIFCSDYFCDHEYKQ